jgi:hypothetical protein
MVSVFWGWLIFNAASPQPVVGQTVSEALFARTMAHLVESEKVRQDLSYSYTLYLTGTFYQKDDSAQITESWQISQHQDSIRVKPLSRHIGGNADLAKKYKLPLEMKAAKRSEQRDQDDPVMAVVLDLLSRIQKDSKAHFMIDGKVDGRRGNPCYVLRFLADGRSGSLWVDAQSIYTERIEWVYGKSFVVASSDESSSIELAPATEEAIFPVKLIFNEQSRALLSRSGAYTEVEIRDFQWEGRQ